MAAGPMADGPMAGGGQARAAGRSRALRWAEVALGLMVATLLMVLMLITAVDVFGRYVLSRPLPGAFEITEITLAMIVFIGLPLVCLRQENVSVTLLTDRFPRRAFEFHAVLVAVLCAAILLLVAWRIVVHSMQLASYGDVTMFLRVPKGPIGYTMAGFTVLAAMAQFVVAAAHLRAWRGRLARRDAADA